MFLVVAEEKMDKLNIFNGYLHCQPGTENRIGRVLELLSGHLSYEVPPLSCLLLWVSG